MTETLLDAEQIEMALDGAGLPWTRRESGWAVTPPDGAGRELLVRAADGLLVDAVLAEWDEAAPESLAALKLFLERAQASIRGVRCTIEGTQARILAEVSAEEIEGELPRAIQVVSAGCRFLAREARALLEADLARQYLAFHSPVHS